MDLHKERIQLSDDEFIRRFQTEGATSLSKLTGISVRNIFMRRSKLEGSLNIQIKAPDRGVIYDSNYPARLPLKIDTGSIVIASDCHYWPGIVSTAHRGLIHVLKELKPKYFILNGDGFDGAQVSRHPPLGWDHTPTPVEEIQAINEREAEINAASPETELYWTLGNHDQRFEMKLAAQAGEMHGLQGFCLKDQLPHWTFAMSIWVNDSVVIKHRYKGGVHATHNNALYAGKTMCTGHLHSLKVTAFTDYTGTRFGVDSGTLADPFGPQFRYSEDNPNNHRSGFIVLNFDKGRLLWPEIVRVFEENVIEFRGKLIKV